MIVDDEEIIRDFLIRLFTFESLDAKAVESGIRAIEAAQKEEFDLFFIDVRMPGIDGIATVKALKKIAPHAKYVMMTGYSLDELLKRLEGEDVEAVITKPFETKEIVAILEDYVRQEYSHEIIDVLIVEAEERVSNFLKKLFQNYKVYVVKTGAEAVSLVGQMRFDLIVTDMLLGDMTGVELYSKIKEIKPEVKVILVTGDAQKTEGVMKDCLQQQIRKLMNFTQP